MSTNPFESPRWQDPSPLRRDGAAEVAAPALALLIVSSIWLVGMLLAMAFDVWLLSSGRAQNMPNALFDSKQTQVQIRLFLSVFVFASDILVLLGAYQMRRCKSYGMAMTAAVLSVIPCLAPCYCIGMPFGIWALVALRKPGVRESFD